MTHVVRARWLLVVLVWCLSLLLPAGASAHAGVVATDPVDGARLPVAPATVSVTFNEPVTLASEGLRVVRPDGSLADVGPEDVSATIVRQAIAPLADGWYVMAWSIVSEDGHVVHGSVTFAVGDADAAARPLPGGTPSALEAALWVTRGTADLALLAGVGALVAGVALAARTRRVAVLRGVALMVAALASAAWLLVEVSDAGADWLSTPYAMTGLARTLLLVGALALVLIRPTRDRAALACGGGALVTLALGGHATGSPLTSLTLAVHLLAGVTWLGAAPAVALVLWDRGVPDEPEALGTVRSFSRLATVTLLAVLGGGIASALLLTNGLEGGPSLYGAIVLAKAGVVGVAALLGARGRRGLATGARRHAYQRLFLLDASLLVVVAGLSSALTLVGPHQGHAGHQGHAAGEPRCAVTLPSGGAAIVLDPGRPGSNGITVTGPAPTARGVGVSLRHPFAGGASTDVTLAPADGAWAGSVALPFTGDWRATILVRVDSFTEQRASCTLRVSP